MIQDIKRITIITGHYGSGKTNFAVNLAVDLCKAGKKVVLVDLDIVNPYFRSADFKEELGQMGIEMICPTYANTNLDIPALGADIYSVFAKEDDRFIVFDVGGDDAGAAALGRYAKLICEQPYDMLYVVNRYRYLTRQPQEALQILREIETTSRISATGVVNNSNLGEQTTVQDIIDALDYGQTVASLAEIPLMATTANRKITADISDSTIYPIDLYVLPPWEK